MVEFFTVPLRRSLGSQAVYHHKEMVEKAPLGYQVTVLTYLYKDI